MKRLVNLITDVLSYKVARQKALDAMTLVIAIVFVIAVFGFMRSLQVFMRMWGVTP